MIQTTSRSLLLSSPTIINKGVVFLQIDNFMKRNVLYSTIQSAKRENSRKETALLKVANDILLKRSLSTLPPLWYQTWVGYKVTNVIQTSCPQCFGQCWQSVNCLEGPTLVWPDAGWILKSKQDVGYETFIFIPGCRMEIGRWDWDMLHFEGGIGDRR